MFQLPLFTVNALGPTHRQIEEWDYAMPCVYVRWDGKAVGWTMISLAQYRLWPRLGGQYGTR